ncbi:MAG TPA: orotate phosphoribosyltransferase [Thermoproteota archaeon]|nr:orotate phosphoribosyltransferase [Thermoproteota archaeon]
MKWELLNGIFEAGMIRFGDFTLSSGKKSPYYVNLRVLPSHVELFGMALSELDSMISQNEQEGTGIASVELSGIPLGAALASRMSVPFVYVRKEAKTYGTGELVEGEVRKAGKFVIVDDVLTTGASVLHAARALRDKGADVGSAYVLLDRLQGGKRFLAENGILVRSSIDTMSAVDRLAEGGEMSIEQRDRIVTYVRSEGASV